MRILYVITKSEVGGAQTHIAQLTKYMVGKRNEVTVMACPGGPLEKISNYQLPISNEFPNSNFQDLNEIKFYPNRYFKNSYNPFLGIGAMREIRKAVNDFKPHIVHCHSSVAGFWTRLALRMAQGKLSVIFTAHGWGFTEGTSFLRRSLVILAEKFVSKYCDKIICVSENDRKLSLKYKISSEDKLITIYNGVEVNEVQNSKIKIQNDNSKFKIIFVGRLAEPKDPLLLIRAFGGLTEEVKSKAEILIVGEGGKRKELEKFIHEKKLNEKVKLLGELPREKVFEILRESDIFVLTSNWEGFPITILEAMSCGLPVIVSNVGGVSEVVDNSVGYLIKRADKEALKRALVQLIENPSLREKMGRNARKRIEDNFSLDKMLERTAQVYRDA